MWVNPEIDQGFGVGDTHGAAGFPSGEAYKLGHAFPYTRVQRYFLRQTVNLGGEEQKVEADINQFAETVTANRLVFTVGKFAVADIFDTNKYANNPKNDFLNWALINAGTFDYAGDAWGFTYGAAAEWYQDRWTVRGGIFDLSATPAGGALNATSYGLDPNFSQFQVVGEIEERHEFLGQPGKLKVTGFLSRGRAGDFQDAVNAANWFGMDPSLALALDRKFRNRPGVSLNLEQQINESVGFFARAGYTDGGVEPWDFTDIDRTVQAGFDFRQGLGTAGRHDRLRRRHQRPRQFARGLFRGRRPWRPHRRRVAARLWTRENPGILLQLCPDAQHQGRPRLSAHRRPRIQRNPRSRESFRGTPPLAVLKRRRTVELSAHRDS